MMVSGPERLSASPNATGIPVFPLGREMFWGAGLQPLHTAVKEGSTDG